MAVKMLSALVMIIVLDLRFALIMIPLGAVLGVMTFGFRKNMKKLQEYLKEVIQELRKVSWPGKEELKGSTTVVIFFSVVMAVFVWGVDFLLSELFKMVIR